MLVVLCTLMKINAILFAYLLRAYVVCFVFFPASFVDYLKWITPTELFKVDILMTLSDSGSVKILILLL